MADEDAAEVIAALNRLAPDDRLALTHRYFLDCPVEELAIICGCSERALRSRLARALTRLRHELERSAASSPTPPPPRRRNWASPARSSTTLRT